jgi:hypothetical protein
MNADVFQRDIRHIPRLADIGAGARAGHAPQSLKVVVHASGYVETSQQATDKLFPGYEKILGRWANDARRRAAGWQRKASGGEDTEAPGGGSRFAFQTDIGALSHARMMRSMN